MIRELKAYLRDHDKVRTGLLDSNYVRSYAFNNEVEFVVVLMECFFETPLRLKSDFPKMHKKLKDMLNFKYLD